MAKKEEKKLMAAMTELELAEHMRKKAEKRPKKAEKRWQRERRLAKEHLEKKRCEEKEKQRMEVEEFLRKEQEKRVLLVCLIIYFIFHLKNTQMLGESHAGDSRRALESGPKL